jgi:hypothetical protein
VFGGLFGIDLPADDLTAEQFHDQIEVEISVLPLNLWVDFRESRPERLPG